MNTTAGGTTTACLCYIPGVAASVAFSVPGSASWAGTEPSMEGASVGSVWDWVNFFPRFVSALAMAEWSVARLASWWNTFRLRMMVYTKFELPGNQTLYSETLHSGQLGKLNMITLAPYSNHPYCNLNWQLNTGRSISLRTKATVKLSKLRYSTVLIHSTFTYLATTCGDSCRNRRLMTILKTTQSPFFSQSPFE